MFYYNRQIVYVDLLEAGHKIGNAGFLKLERTEDAVRWNIRIKGLHETDTGFFDIRDETGALVDKMLLKHGEGTYSREFELAEENRGGRRYEEICGIRIALPGTRALEGCWCAAEKKPGYCLRAADDERRTAVRGTAARGMAEAGEGVPGTGVPGPVTAGIALAGTGVPGTADRPEDAGMTGAAAEGPQEGRPKEQQEALYEDKWEQLRHMYPTVHPFGDEREFLSILPRDFVILGREYQKMVHNSFLLHGYYNYRHIILGKYGEEETETIYLGVPGVYYDREKMAAEMFGFEAFEGKVSPAEPGSFGYYMKQVKI